MVAILTNLLNQHLKNKTRKVRFPRSYFYASESGLTPYEIYKKLSYPQTLSPKRKILMRFGSITHRRVYKILREMGILKAAEVKVGDDLFRGFADAIIQLPGEEEMPLEIKTVSKKGFDGILRRTMPTWKSYLQLQLYLHYLNMDSGRILFIETKTLEDYRMPLEEFMHDQRMREFLIKKNPKIINQTLKKFSKLKEFFIKGGLMTK